MYYIGETFEDSKEYKTFENAKKAAEKKNLKIWDDEGNEVKEERTLAAENEQEVLTTEVKQPAENEQEVLTTEVKQPAENEQEVLTTEVKQPAENEQEVLTTEVKQPAENEQEVPTTEVKATVIFDGLLNIRRRPSWDSDAVCGKAVKGQTYIVSEILDVDGKKMIRTFGDLYLTADERYVIIEPI